MTNKIIYIQSCNFENYPIGGQLTFAKNMLNAFGNDLILVGITTDDTPVGVWVKKEINGVLYDFLSVQRKKERTKKSFIPQRIVFYFKVRKYKKKILQKQSRIIFTRTPDVIFAARRWKLKKRIFCFAGTGNPMALGQRWYGRIFARFFDELFFPALSEVDVILAAADTEHIKDTVKRSKGALRDGDIKHFPTRIDTSIFNNRDRDASKQKLNIPIDQKVVVTSGRLHWAKGWKLMIDAFELFKKRIPESILFFIGDGDDRDAIERYINEKKLQNNIFLLGFQPHQLLSDYLNAASLYIMGSQMEGWATSLLEAKACGVPLCTTEFSSAKDIIDIGIDGYVVEQRDSKIFFDYMLKAIELKINDNLLEEKIKRYSLKNLKADFWDFADKKSLDDINF